MKRLIIIIMAALLIPLGATASQAHFEQGANCHIDNVSQNGVVTFRVTNRLYTDAEVLCRLRFNNRNHPTGWFRITLNARTWEIDRWRYRGHWTRVWITHVHVTPLYDP